MSNSARSKAEQQFASTQSKAKQALKLKEKAEKDRMDHMARLRELRLAKEAADRAAAADTGGKAPSPARSKASKAAAPLGAAGENEKMFEIPTFLDRQKS